MAMADNFRLRRAPEGRKRLELLLAVLRAIETRRNDSIVTDSHSSLLLDSIDDPIVKKLYEIDPGRLGFISDFTAVNTRFFDEALLTAAANGVRQFVLLAGGFDMRAYRLSWPTGTTIYELDNYNLLKTKDDIMYEHNIRSTAEHRLVGRSLEENWRPALTSSGFNPELPTGWLAKAIIANLATNTHNALFERLIELSAPGSVIVTDYDHVAPSGASWEDLIEGTAPDELRSQEFWLVKHYGQRTLPAEWLSGHGWLTSTYLASECAKKYGRSFPVELPAPQFEVTQRKWLYSTLPISYF